MAGNPVPGAIYLNPTNATTGGTKLIAIERNRIEWEDGVKVRHVGTGVDPDAWETLRTPGRPALLRIAMRDESATARKLVHSALSTSGSSLNSDPAAGSGTYMFQPMPGNALGFRPDDTSELYLYTPRAAIAEDAEIRRLASRIFTTYHESDLILALQRSLDGSKQAFKWDTAAAINSYYGL